LAHDGRADRVSKLAQPVLSMTPAKTARHFTKRFGRQSVVIALNPDWLLRAFTGLRGRFMTIFSCLPRSIPAVPR
jgi:hypothetical protein